MPFQLDPVLWIFQKLCLLQWPVFKIKIQHLHETEKVLKCLSKSVLFGTLMKLLLHFLKSEQGVPKIQSACLMADFKVMMFSFWTTKKREKSVELPPHLHKTSKGIGLWRMLWHRHSDTQTLRHTDTKSNAQIPLQTMKRWLEKLQLVSFQRFC